jgi:pyroglutamyl-peptidase
MKLGGLSKGDTLMKTLLVTGFEPFGGESVNPSWECAAALPEAIGDVRIVRAKLPVVWGRINGELNALLDAHGPDAVLSLGQAGGRNAINIERVAINLRDSVNADNAGIVKQNEPVVLGGPDGLFSTLPCYEMKNALDAAHIPAAFSYTAGPYLCNDAMYVALYRASLDMPRMIAGFVHVPYMKGQSETSFVMELSQMVLGVEILCKVVCGRLGE